MNRPKLVRLLLLAIVILGSTAGMAVPAGAQVDTQPPAPEGGGTVVVNSWALAPTGADPSEPSSRVFFSYTIDPGATLNDSATLWNYSNVQLTFQIYPTDAYNNADGAFDLLPGDQKPVDVGSWITLPQSFITVQAQSKIDIPFTLTVPPDARPGDHAAAVLAANQVTGAGPDGKVVALDRRTGSRVYLRVAGPVTPALILENVHSVYHSALNPLSGSLDVTYTVRNTGNVRLGAHQHIDVNGPFGFGLKQRTPKDVPELLPGNAVTLHEHFTHVPAVIRVTAEIKLDPFGAADATDVHVVAVTRGAHTWAIPWSLIALVVELWLAWKVYVAYRRRRREREDAAKKPPMPRRDRDPGLTTVP